MLGDVLSEPHRNWCHTSPSSITHYGPHHRRRAHVRTTCFPVIPDCRTNHRCIANGLSPVGEGSWNVAWDVRPARWIHRPDNALLIFGICWDSPQVELTENGSEVKDNDEGANGTCETSELKKSNNYRITGVPADGRCLFRAIAHVVCLRNGEEAPDENRQKELADELRVQVVDELTKRRKETEWFIEGDFDAYVKRIQKTYVWGGEPELLMASHVLKTTISVYMFEKDSNNLSKIATYGEEYEQVENSSIKVLFHGYGHYDILEETS